MVLYLASHPTSTQSEQHQKSNMLFSKEINHFDQDQTKGDDQDKK